MKSIVTLLREEADGYHKAYLSTDPPIDGVYLDISDTFTRVADALEAELAGDDDAVQASW